MNEEEFYEIMYEMCSLLKTDYFSKFKGILDALDLTEEIKEEFDAIIKAKTREYNV